MQLRANSTVLIIGAALAGLFLAACSTDAGSEVADADGSALGSESVDSQRGSTALEAQPDGAMLTTDRRTLRVAGQSAVSFVDWDTGEMTAHAGAAQGGLRTDDSVYFAAGETDQFIVAVETATGIGRWRWPLPAGMRLSSWKMTDQGILLSAGPDDLDAAGVIVLLDTDGQVVWRDNVQPRHTLPLVVPTRSSVLAASGQGSDGTVTLRRTADGSEAWSGIDARAVAAGADMLISHEGGVDVWDGASGRQIASVPGQYVVSVEARGGLVEPFGTPSETAVFLTAEIGLEFASVGHLHVIEGSDLIASHPVDFGRAVLWIEQVVDGSLAVVLTTDSFVAVDLDDGSIAWRQPRPVEAFYLVATEDYVFLPDDPASAPMRTTARTNGEFFNFIERSTFTIGPATPLIDDVVGTEHDWFRRDGATDDLLVARASGSDLELSRETADGPAWTVTIEDGASIALSAIVGYDEPGVELVRTGPSQLLGIDRLSGQQIWISDDALGAGPTTGSVEGEPLTCEDPCRVTGSFEMAHPSWGDITIVTMHSSGPSAAYSQCGRGGIAAVGDGDAVLWRADFGESSCGVLDVRPVAEERHPINATGDYEPLAPVDGRGIAFINYDIGRLNSVIVLIPTADGFDSLDTIPPAGYDVGAIYGAEVVDLDDDGRYEMITSENDCDPTCAEGTTVQTVLEWIDGRYVETGVLAQPEPEPEPEPETPSSGDTATPDGLMASLLAALQAGDQAATRALFVDPVVADGIFANLAGPDVLGSIPCDPTEVFGCRLWLPDSPALFDLTLVQTGSGWLVENYEFIHTS